MPVGTLLETKAIFAPVGLVIVVVIGIIVYRLFGTDDDEAG